MNIFKKRKQILMQHRGKTYGEIAALYPDTERDKELDILLRNKKGPIGVWLEWFLTGNRPDNLSEADHEGIEIKALAVRPTPDGFKPYENMRLSIVNFTKIQATTFDDSSILKKSNMLIAINSKPASQKGKDAIFYGLGTIDLNSVAEQCQIDYEYIRNQCKEGQADQLCSRIDQPGVYLKTYSSGNGKNLRTYSAGGRICEAKGKAMYLFKAQWMELFKLMEE